MKSILTFLLLLSVTAKAQKTTNVIITGKIADKKHLSISIPINVLSTNWTSIPIQPDSTFILKFYIPNKQSVNIENNQVFCEPGDSIYVDIKGDQLRFMGKNAAHYNYYANFMAFDKLNKEVEIEEREKLENGLGSDLLVYKNKKYEVYLKRKAFLDEYCSKYQCSKQFEEWAFAQIFYLYIYSLSSEYRSVKNEDSKIERAYFENLNLTVLQNEKYTNSFNYFLGLNTFLECYLAKSTTNEKISVTLKKQFNFIKSNFTATTKDILLVNLLQGYFEKKDAEYELAIDTIYKESQSIFTNKNYYEELRPFYIKYKSFNFLWDKDSTITLKNSEEKDVFLTKLFNSYKGNIVFLDFWASWCQPCRMEMPYSKELEKIYESKKIKFIYLSKDKEFNAWQKALKDESMSKENNFILNKKATQFFQNNIDLSLIPRYVILDKNGKIIHGDAPRPSDPKLKKLLDKLLEE
ncbi:MAG: TlpA family protein disulfide reductase [Sphingobacteriaceae bacterium]|nr:TlpA family protein disulfide reductase [Sphingobacteriaceae bacterium]